MAIPQSPLFRVPRRPLAILMIVGLAIVPILAQAPRSGTREVVAIRELEVKPGVDEAEFERFIVTRYNPAWAQPVPGLRGYIAKGDRGAHKGRYALVLVFESQKTRDAIFPKEGGGAADKFIPMLKGPFGLNEELDKYIEPGSFSIYTDYVALR